jgi:hypothetical protein
VKVDNANRSAVLDAQGKVLPRAAEVLGKENEVNIAKVAWLSRRDEEKLYGSMVVYVTKGSDAARLLQDQYFHLAGESAYTSIFEPRFGPKQCYKCQELGHKAFSCTKPRVYTIKYDASSHRIRCFGHIINLAAQSFLFATKDEELEGDEGNTRVKSTEEGLSMWRKKGPLGKLHNINTWVNATEQRLQKFLGLANTHDIVYLLKQLSSHRQSLLSATSPSLSSIITVSFLATASLPGFK